MGTGPPAYQVTKAALNAMTRTLAGELRGAHILVNAVCPGWVATDMGGSGAPRSVSQGAAGIVWADSIKRHARHRDELYGDRLVQIRVIAYFADFLA